jgi:hypothetical protein
MVGEESDFSPKKAANVGAIHFFWEATIHKTDFLGEL